MIPFRRINLNNKTPEEIALTLLVALGIMLTIAILLGA